SMHFSSFRNLRQSRITLNGRHRNWATSRPTMPPRTYSVRRSMSFTKPEERPASFRVSGATGASGMPSPLKSVPGELRAMATPGDERVKGRPRLPLAAGDNEQRERDDNPDDQDHAIDVLDEATPVLDEAAPAELVGERRRGHGGRRRNGRCS